jgi:hypothetical protein
MEIVPNFSSKRKQFSVRKTSNGEKISAGLFDVLLSVDDHVIYISNLVFKTDANAKRVFFDSFFKDYLFEVYSFIIYTHYNKSTCFVLKSNINEEKYGKEVNELAEHFIITKFKFKFERTFKSFVFRKSSDQYEESANEESESEESIEEEIYEKKYRKKKYSKRETQNMFFKMKMKKQKLEISITAATAIINSNVKDEDKEDALKFLKSLYQIDANLSITASSSCSIASSETLH